VRSLAMMRTLPTTGSTAAVIGSGVSKVDIAVPLLGVVVGVCAGEKG
jgi:hypothetical protein